MSFYAGETTNINNLSGSGLGFYSSAGFGGSVPVLEYQGTTYITSSAGTSLGPQADNIKYTNPGSGAINGASSSGIGLLSIPNYQATLNIRVNNDTAIRITSATLRIYDRSNINNNPSGVTCKVAEIIHPGDTQVPTGSGDSTWLTPAGSSVTVSLAPSPGRSGQYAGNGSSSAWYDTQHDWYVAISASPDSVGSKLFGLYCDFEYV